LFSCIGIDVSYARLCACSLGAYGRIEHLNIRFGEPRLAGKARTERVVSGQVVSFPDDDVDELNSLLRFQVNPKESTSVPFIRS
jgi:hypothetical protein